MTTAPLRQRRSAGLTLMETIVVIGIMVMVLLLAMQMLVTNYVFYEKTVGRAENEAGAVLAAKNLSQMVWGATAVETSHDFDGETFTTSSAVLVVRIPSIDDSGAAVAEAYDYIGFGRDGANPTRILAATDANVLSVRQTGRRLVTDHNVRLDFRYNSPEAAQASRVSAYILNRQVRHGTVLESQGWTSVFLRNF